MQLDVELGNDVSDVERDMTHTVHWTMKYLLKDGNDMSPEMIDTSMGVLSGVVQNSSGVPKISALHMMSIMLIHTGQPTYAQEYVRMTSEEQQKVEHVELVGIEYQ